MRTVASFLALLGMVAAVPAGAQMTAGGDLDVYDANSELVGRLVALDYLWNISMEAPNGDAVVLSYYASDVGDEGWYDEPTIHFELSDCSGSAYIESPIYFIPKNSSGEFYATGGSSNVYKTDLTTAASATAVSSYLYNGVCFNSIKTPTVRPLEFVATVSAAYPFYLARAAPNASAVPPWTFGIIAGALGMSGGWLASQRKHTRSASAGGDHSDSVIVGEDD